MNRSRSARACLTVVDCLDALASDRQYRRALPLDEAMAAIVAESGVSFDPKIVEVLQENYCVWEKLAWANEPAGHRLSKEVHISKGSAPAAGLQAGDSQQPEFLTSIAAARQEAQTLYELTQDLGNSLNLHETLSVLDSRLQRLIPYDAIAVYVLRDGCLFPEYVNGENFRLFSSLQIPVGSGTLRLGGRNRQADRQREPVGRAGLPERSEQVQQSALGAGGAARKRRRRDRRPGAVPSGARRVQDGPPARPAGDQSEGVA